MNQTNHFVLVDCNNFYVSCERLFNPKLEGRPVIVLSNNDGCVVARSQEAKQFGIAMGEPFFKIKEFCRQRDILVYSSNYQMYGDISQRIMQILSELAPEIQVYSIDEAFLTFPATLSPDILLEQCFEMRRLIKKWVGIPTSIGIAPTKTLAKVANAVVKKNRSLGVFSLCDPARQQQILADFPVGDIWGIGSRLKARLQGLGIFTALEFRDKDSHFIRREMGVVGERMLWELRGMSCLPLEEPCAKQSISCSRSFGCTVTCESDLAEALATYVTRACEKLRGQGSCAKALHVYVEVLLDAQTGTRGHESRIVSFTVPTNDTPQMINAAKRCLKQLFCEGKRYKKCGVVLMDLIPEESIIPDLFLPAISPQRQHLMHTVDALNARFGKNKLFYGAMGVENGWKMRRDQRWSCSTGEWGKLPVVRA